MLESDMVFGFRKQNVQCNKDELFNKGKFSM